MSPRTANSVPLLVHETWSAVNNFCGVDQPFSRIVAVHTTRDSSIVESERGLFADDQITTTLPLLALARTGLTGNEANSGAGTGNAARCSLRSTPMNPWLARISEAYSAESANA